MAKYILTKNGVLKQNLHIPASNGNRDWQEYQVWLNDGGIPIPIQPSKHHELIDDVWVLNQILLDAENKKIKNLKAKNNLRTIDEESIWLLRKFLVEKFGDDSAMPPELIEAESDAKIEKAKLTD